MGRAHKILTLFLGTFNLAIIEANGFLNEAIQCIGIGLGMDKCIFDSIGQVLIKAVSEIWVRVTSSVRVLFECSGISGDSVSSLPEALQDILCIYYRVYRFETSFEGIFERLPIWIDKSGTLCPIGYLADVFRNRCS